jgi:hypothetical protein
MGSQFQSLIDVTIVYPGGVPSFWEFLCGRTQRVVLRAREVAIPAEFAQGDYETDSVFRGNFHRWLADIWAFKDAQIDALLAPAAVAAEAVPTRA